MKHIILILAILFISGCEKEDLIECWVYQDREFVLMEVTRASSFINGGEEGMSKLALNEINYPEEARENGTEGTVELQYEISENGTVENIEIILDIGDGSGEESCRVLKLVTQGTSFHPAEIDNIPVRTRKELPVSFKLE